MSQTGLAAFDSTLQTTNTWLHQIMDEMGWLDRHQAYYALRTVLHALRDRLPAEQAAALGAQLPMLIRGFYYEGWHPGGTPVRERKKAGFLELIAQAYPKRLEADPERLVEAIFRVLAEHLSEGEVEHVKQLLPAEIRRLWP
jgi:uncharacterized protein (DUF2267 family)